MLQSDRENTVETASSDAFLSFPVVFWGVGVDGMGGLGRAGEGREWMSEMQTAQVPRKSPSS